MGLEEGEGRYSLSVDYLSSGMELPLELLSVWFTAKSSKPRTGSSD